jgi:hypothetical protein
MSSNTERETLSQKDKPDAPSLIKKPQGVDITVVIVCVLLAVFFLLTIISQLVRHFHNPLRTEFALYYEDTESVLFKGVYIRTERQIAPAGFAQYANNPDSVIHYTNKCGAKLSINSVIAVVYSSQAEISNRRRIVELQEQIDTLSEARLFVGASTVETQSSAQIEAFSGQLSDTHLRILRDISTGNFEGAVSHKNSYLGLQGKINAARGFTDSVGLDERISALRAQKSHLESLLNSPIQEIRVPEAGYFAGIADGYESALRFADARSITREQVEDIIANPALAVADNVAGRIIDDYKWRMAALIETDKVRGISQGATVNLRIGTFPQAVPAVVIHVENQGDGVTLFVFESELLNEEFVKKRVASVRLLLDDFAGIRLPQSAVTFRINEAGESERGVYVKNGSVIVFRRINLLRSEEEFVIVENTDRAGWLRLYDEVVVSGRSLYDGKIVS